MYFSHIVPYKLLLSISHTKLKSNFRYKIYGTIVQRDCNVGKMIYTIIPSDQTLIINAIKRHSTVDIFSLQLSESLQALNS